MKTPTLGLPAVLLRALLVGGTVLLLASYVVSKNATGEWRWLWAQAPLAQISADSGFSYRAPAGRADLGSPDHPSLAYLFENGSPLGPIRSRDEIRAKGLGGFTVSDGALFFSSSDNTDPRANGRDYAISYPSVGGSRSTILFALTLVVWLSALVLATWYLQSQGAHAGWIASGASWLLASLTKLYAAIQEPARKACASPAPRRTTAFALVGLWVVALLFVMAAETTFLTRTGQWTQFWGEQPLGAIQPDTGVAYRGFTGNTSMGPQSNPSPAALLEDGVQLGLRNASPVEIRTQGRGLYAYWRDHVVFATSDNSDPRTNGRRYTVSYPPISQAAARGLYLTAAVVLLFTVLITLLLIQQGVLAVIPAPVLRRIQRYGVAGLGIASVASLVAIGTMRAFPVSSPLVPDLWGPVFALNLVSACAFRARYGSKVPGAVAAAFLVALAAGYYFMTVWAPHRTQGCHVTDPRPAWSVFCTSGDSGSYYYGYAPGSTRQPLYPWFIAAMTAGTGFNPSEYAKTAAPGTPKSSERDPLIRVVHGQIVLLLAASLVACFAFMKLLGTPLPAVVFLWMYDRGFFTAMELNVVLTESLVQAMVLLLVATFLLFAVKRGHLKLVLAGVFAGLAFLTRQASAYCALILVVMITVALFEDRRRWWKSSVAALFVFVALVTVPDVMGVIASGGLGKQQDSLQYQYRIAHAMQYAVEADLELMPDEESRSWLADAIKRRDIEHRAVEAQFPDPYSRQVYYINVNLYSVATPTGVTQKSPRFFMQVATPVLVRHWLDYLQFGFDFWRFGLTLPGLARLGFFGFSPWLTYLVLFVMIVLLRDLRALAAATFILCHWGAVAISSLLAVPLARIVWASECLVLFAALMLFWTAAERLAETPIGSPVRDWFQALFGRETGVAA